MRSKPGLPGGRDDRTEERRETQWMNYTVGSQRSGFGCSAESAFRTSVGVFLAPNFSRRSVLGILRGFRMSFSVYPLL